MRGVPALEQTDHSCSRTSAVLLSGKTMRYNCCGCSGTPSTDTHRKQIHNCGKQPIYEVGRGKGVVTRAKRPRRSKVRVIRHFSALLLSLYGAQGIPFVNQLVKELHKLLDVKRVTTSGFRPECNGCCERYNQTLTHILSKYVDQQQRTWDEVPQFVVFASNTSRHDTTGSFPFELLFGRDRTLPLDIALPTAQEPFVQDVEKRRRDLHAAANSRIETKQNYTFAQDDHPDVQFAVGAGSQKRWEGEEPYSEGPQDCGEPQQESPQYKRGRRKI